jgi:hypothetical protein
VSQDVPGHLPEDPDGGSGPPGGGPAPRREFSLDVPAEAEVGFYADFASIWHTPETFVLDFAVLKRPPQTATAPDGSANLVFPTRVVARVRLPPAQIFELMKALEQQLTMWERERGSSA